MRLVQIGILIGAMGLSACSGGPLHELVKPGEGPDEFRIVPGKPLQAPESYSELPPPAPGSVNLTDQRPLQESVAELGGNRRSEAGPIPGSDGGVVNYVSRFGRDPSIRQTLAVEDEAFRKRRARFTGFRIVREDRYGLVYRRETLDAKEEQLRWRRAGARTPSASP